MDIKEFLLLYVPYKDKIDSLIPDDVIREYILSEVLSPTCVPYEQTKKILHHEFFADMIMMLQDLLHFTALYQICI